jgi:hypothetical protein
MSKNKIKHISFLFRGERKISKANHRGLFVLSVPNPYRSSPNKSYFTAMKFVTHPTVKDSDPVLTLSTGEKIRVYVGGTGDWMVVQAQGIMETHDKLSSDSRPASKKPAEKALGKKMTSAAYEDLDLFGDWNDW